MVCLNERFVNPGRLRGLVRDHRCARSARSIGGGLRDGRTIKALQIGGPLGGHPAGLAARHAVRLRPARGGGLHGRSRRHRRLRRSHRHARARPSPAAFRRAARAAASASPAGSGCGGRSRWSRPRAASTGRELEELLETLEVASLCAHGGGHAGADPQLDQAFPGRAGGHLAMEVFVDGVRGRGRARHHRPGGRQAGRSVGADAVPRRSHGALRRLPCVPGRRSRERAGRWRPARPSAATA